MNWKIDKHMYYAIKDSLDIAWYNLIGREDMAVAKNYTDEMVVSMTEQ